MKFMTMVRASENSGPPPKALIDAIGELGMEATKAGVMVQMGGLLPTATGALVQLAGGELTVTDGPFTETKEVIGGFAVYDVKSKAEAIEWSKRFLDLHRRHWPGWTGVVELRQMFDPSDFAPGAGPCH
jgi:hypothetical protein